jgi:NAD+ kinase
MTSAPGRLGRIGLVVHPSRDLSEPLGGIGAWAREHGTELVQLPVPGVNRHLAPEGVVADCDLVVSIGGDGTMLAAVRAAIDSQRPVLGIAWGSLGVLTRTVPQEVGAALDAVAAGAWADAELPALRISGPDGLELLALNDLSVMRAGAGQIRVTVLLDGTLYGRVAGDGVIVATPLGSSAYSLAAGGPLLAAGARGFLLTPLATHGGEVPPLVAGPDAQLELRIDQGFGGARLELDGQIAGEAPATLTVEVRPAVARFVTFAGQPPLLTVLRERGLLVDSPRILAEDARVEMRG